MKRYFTLLSLTFFVNVAFAQVNQAQARTTDQSVVAPAATVDSCKRATQKLGDNVIKGNYLYALEKMYPRYRKRQNVKHGEQKFNELVLNMSKTLNNMGVTITSFKADKPIGFFKVWRQIKPAAKLKIARGEQKDVIAGDVFHNWLMIVPTTQVWTFTSNKGGPPRKLKREGFQVAVAQEKAVSGQEEWTFLDGGTLTPQELRAMFPSLPQTLVLPKREDSEIK